MEEIKNDAGVGKVGLHPGDVGRAHIHDHLADRFGLGPVGWHSRNELGHSLGTAPFDHEQKVMALGIEHDSDVAMPLPCACLVNHDPTHLAPVFGPMGFHDIVLEHPPKPFVALPQLASPRRHAHLLAQQQDHGLHHEGKSAAGPSPWHCGLQDSVFLAVGAGPRHGPAG